MTSIVRTSTLVSLISSVSKYHSFTILGGSLLTHLLPLMLRYFSIDDLQTLPRLLFSLFLQLSRSNTRNNFKSLKFIRFSLACPEKVSDRTQDKSTFFPILGGLGLMLSRYSRVILLASYVLLPFFSRRKLCFILKANKGSELGLPVYR